MAQWRAAALRLGIAALAYAAIPATAGADEPSAIDNRRTASCETRSFERAALADGGVAYTEKSFKVTAAAKVGEALLDWCQPAQNAVIFFYVADPKSADTTKCPQNMSFAVFPGRGAEAREIIDGNVESYDNPQVKVIEAVKTGPTSIAAQGRTIEAYQLEGVVEQNGAPTRKRMIGYSKDGDFVRVMTGYVDSAACGHKTVDGFLAALKWP